MNGRSPVQSAAGGIIMNMCELSQGATSTLAMTPVRHYIAFQLLHKTQYGFGVYFSIRVCARISWLQNTCPTHC